MKKICFALLIGFVSFNCMAQSNQKVLLNHIAVYVVDLKISTAFYNDIVGLDTIGVKSHLHIISGAVAKKEHDKNTHLCFSVGSVPEFVKVLAKNKVEYENWAGEKMAITTRVDGVKQIYFKDPDGYWIEINDAKE
jgi:lactoylglutathione lyase